MYYLLYCDSFCIFQVLICVNSQRFFDKRLFGVRQTHRWMDRHMTGNSC